MSLMLTFRDDAVFTANIGAEAGVYAAAFQALLRVELGFVAASRATVPYNLQENGVELAQEYYAPSIRYGGTRVAIVVGAFF